MASENVMLNGSFVRIMSGIALGAAFTGASAQSIERVRPGDVYIDCAAIGREHTDLDAVIAAGDSNSNSTTRAVAGGAANVGGQVAGAAIAQNLGGMFGAFGSILSQAAGAGAQQAAQQQLKPTAAQVQRAGEAKARKDFLTRLANAKDCRSNDPGYAGRNLSAQAFDQLAYGVPASTVSPADAAPVAMTRDSIAPALNEIPTVLPSSGLFDGKLDLKGKRFYVAEFRVLFEVEGKVTASTRAGYLPGRNYGATSARINYKVNNPDIAALQALTDRAYEDFRWRLFQADIRVEDSAAFVRSNGAVYEALEEASRPGAPVYLSKNFGHVERKYLVMAPTGMKLHSRGLAGLGAGNIGKRIDFVKTGKEGLSISMAVNLAALESSGSGSSILRSGSNVNAGEGMTISASPDSLLVQGHANASGVRMTKELPVEGNFATFRETSSFSSNTDATSMAMRMLSNQAGVASNNISRQDMEVELNGPTMARMALRGLATINQTVVDQIRAGM